MACELDKNISNWLNSLPTEFELPVSGANLDPGTLCLRACDTDSAADRLSLSFARQSERAKTSAKVPNPKKRRYRLLTPSATSDEDIATLLGTGVGMADPTTPIRLHKRHRPEEPDNDETPRAPVAPGDSASQVSGGVGSSVSGRSAKSATRQFTALELSERNTLKLEFSFFSDLDVGDDLSEDGREQPDDVVNTAELPGPLQDVRTQLFQFSSALRIIPRSHTEDARRIKLPESIAIGPDTFYDEVSEPRRYGPVPSAASVRSIVRNTHECSTEMASEAVWNDSVHGNLLRLALRKDSVSMRGGLVNYAICTSATVHPAIRRGGPAKMIDFAIYVDPERAKRQRPGIQQSIRELRSRSPSETVNSTGSYFLRQKPIAVSIETKKGDDWDVARLQIGTWHAAHWEFLDRVRSKGDGHKDEGPGFLPGIIIQGADWYFVASVRAGDVTTLWTRQLIGSTQTLLGTYRVIRTVQYLAHWSSEVYWPWFSWSVLRLESEES